MRDIFKGFQSYSLLCERAFGHVFDLVTPMWDAKRDPPLSLPPTTTITTTLNHNLLNLQKFYYLKIKLCTWRSNFCNKMKDKKIIYRSDFNAFPNWNKYGLINFSCVRYWSISKLCVPGWFITSIHTFFFYKVNWIF